MSTTTPKNGGPGGNTQSAWIGATAALLLIKALPFVVFPLALIVTGDERGKFRGSPDFEGVLYTIWAIVAVATAIGLVFNFGQARNVGMLILASGFVFAIYHGYFFGVSKQQMSLADELAAGLHPTLYLIALIGLCSLRFKSPEKPQRR